MSNNENNNNEDNVIPFPERPAPTPTHPIGELTKVRFDLENRKVMISGSLASLLLVMTFLNYSLFDSSDKVPVAGSANGRSIASQSVFDRDTSWEHKLAKELNSKKERGIASVGRKPSSIDQLKYGELQGKYSLELKNHKITKISFVPSEDGFDEPKYFNDRMKFIEEHKHLLPVNYVGAKLVGAVRENGKAKEIYRLFDSDSNPSGDVHFTLDEHKRLLMMQVVKN